MIELQIREDYRALHQIPELDDALPKTVAYICHCLKPLGCQLVFPIQGSVCAYFDRQKSKTIAFRADCDALPVQEQTGLPFASAHSGCMHACGHDGHTAILLELARRIPKTAKYNVLLIFQPSEETTGGAKRICDTGILETYRVQAIFALHLWPGLPKGEIYSRPGLLMAGSAPVTAKFLGKAVHVAYCGQGADALCACCRFYAMAQRLPCFLKFGQLIAGCAGNVICQEAVLEGTLRTKKSTKKYQAQLKRLCQRACRCTGCQGRICFGQGYPAVCNDIPFYKKATGICEIHRLPKALWTAEDFSYYQQKVPGVYFLLGVGDTEPLHSPRFCFDETVLSKGAELFGALLQKL